jgi:hypothetical protein
MAISVCLAIPLEATCTHTTVASGCRDMLTMTWLCCKAAGGGAVAGLGAAALSSLRSVGPHSRVDSGFQDAVGNVDVAGSYGLRLTFPFQQRCSAALRRCSRFFVHIIEIWRDIGAGGHCGRNAENRVRGPELESTTAVQTRRQRCCREFQLLRRQRVRAIRGVYSAGVFPRCYASFIARRCCMTSQLVQSCTRPPTRRPRLFRDSAGKNHVFTGMDSGGPRAGTRWYRSKQSGSRLLGLLHGAHTQCNACADKQRRLLSRLRAFRARVCVCHLIHRCLVSCRRVTAAAPPPSSALASRRNACIATMARGQGKNKKPQQEITLSDGTKARRSRWHTDTSAV